MLSITNNPTLGRYQLISLVGSGGMADVYKAYQLGLDRYVAVKVLHTHLADEPGFIERFEREAASVARLRHPNIVQVIDFDRQNNQYYMVMEFIDGPTLRGQQEEREEPYRAEEAAYIVSGVTGGLDYAHGRGVVHRDIKPANIMFTGEGQVVLTDFGIAHIVGTTLYTDSGGMLGTPAYMAPEQGRGEMGDARSDIYSFGVVLYEMLTGRLPYEADTPVGMIQQHMEGQPPPPRMVNSHIPEDVEAVILKAMAVDPGDRYQHAGEMAGALLEAIGLGIEGVRIYPLVREEVIEEEEIAERPLPPCPYRGLFAFREEDAPYFYGREAFTDRLVAAVEEKPLVGVVGPSGCGKSSVVFAGLLPHLRQAAGLRGAEGRAWRIAVCRPGTSPFYSLATALVPQLEGDVSDTARLVGTQKMALALRKGDTSLVELSQDILEGKPQFGQLLLVVDQFEELFTLCQDDDERRRFIDVLLEGIEADSPMRLVLTIRADFLNQSYSYRNFADALQDADLILGPMTRGELAQAVENPAKKQGVSFEDGLLERILDDVGDEPGTLPLLEFALTQLWEQQKTGRLSNQAYEAIGSVEGALAHYADQVFAELEESQRIQSRRVFTQMVMPGEGTEDTRRLAQRDEIGENDWTLVQALANARLVVTGLDIVSGQETVEVVHEALIQSWGQLSGWMMEDRAFRTWQERLRAAMHGWEASGRDEGALLRGGPLVEAKSWLDERQTELSQAEVAYIQESVDLREHQQVVRNRRRWYTIITLAAGLLLALLLAFWANSQRIRAENAEQDALRQASIGLAAQSLIELEGEAPERAVLLALEALEYYPYTWQAERALGQTIMDGRLRLILSHNDFVNTAEWSSDGTKILTGSSDGTVRLWDATSGEELLNITNGAPTLASWSPEGKSILTVNPKEVILKVWDLEKVKERFTLNKDDIEGELNINLEQWNPWSPTGDHLLTYSMDGVAKIWNVGTGEMLKTLLVNPGQADLPTVAPEDMEKLFHQLYEQGDQVLWSPVGDMIAVSSNTHNRVSIWEVKSGEEIYTIPGGYADKHVFIGSWSPSGDRFVTRGLGGIKVYDSSSGNLLIEIDVPEVFIHRAIWSPDESRLLTSGIDDGTARVWDAESGKELIQIPNMVFASGSDWSTSGDIMAVGGNDGMIHVWDTDKNREIRKLFGTQPMINIVAFSPNGDSLLAVGDESIVHVYDLSEAILSVGFDIGPDDLISTGAWSPDGKRVALGIGNNTAKVWSATSGDQQLILKGHAGIIWMISWDPSGDHIMTASEDHTVIIWDADTGEQQLIYTGHDDEVLSSFWSPDGRLIASNDISSGKVILWDPNTGEEILTFSGHQDFISGPFWSPDGERILSVGSHGEALIWNTTTGEIYHDLFPSDYQLDIVAAAWTKDGEQVFIQSADGVFHTFETTSGRELAKFEMPGATLSLFSLSPNEERILKGGVGGAKVWDLNSGAELMTYDVPGWVDASYSPDGTKILIGSNHGIIEIYPTWHSALELIEYARECCLVRDLTLEERALFGLPER